jgi:2-haloalkanoic acid dehalogenase type II
MVKAIMFDFWGTVVENGIFPSPVRQARLILNIDRLPFPLFILEFEKSLMTKRYDDLYKAFEGVCDEFKLKPTKDKLDMLVGMWNKNRMLAKPFPEAIEALEELRKKYKIILVSNTDSISVDSVLEKYGLKKHFDSIYLSCDMGMLKSNPKMFEAILKKEKLEKEDVIMIGDSIESDLIAAEKVGIKGFLVDRNNKREYPDKILTLSEVAARI